MRRATHGGVTLPVSLDARGVTREPIQLAGRMPLRQVNSFARSRGKKDRAPFYPATGSLVGQREDRLSETLPPGSGGAAQAGLYVSGQGNGLSHSFSSCAALKLSQFANAVFDISAGLLIALFIILLFASPFIAAFCLFFLSF